jgi:hypothetical protein
MKLPPTLNTVYYTSTKGINSPHKEQKKQARREGMMSAAPSFFIKDIIFSFSFLISVS